MFSGLTGDKTKTPQVPAVEPAAMLPWSVPLTPDDEERAEEIIAQFDENIALKESAVTPGEADLVAQNVASHLERKLAENKAYSFTIIGDGKHSFGFGNFIPDPGQRVEVVATKPADAIIEAINRNTPFAGSVIALQANPSNMPIRYYVCMREDSEVSPRVIIYTNDPKDEVIQDTTGTSQRKLVVPVKQEIAKDVFYLLNQSLK